MNFEQIYNEFFKIIYSYIITRVCDEPLAQDIAANTWHKVLRYQDNYDSAKGNMRQWLFTIARNEINMHFRLYHIKKFFTLSEREDTHHDNSPDMNQTLIERQEKQALLGAMSALSARERDIIALKFYSGLTNREISGLLKISESNAGTIVNRSMAKLRLALEAK